MGFSIPDRTEAAFAPQAFLSSSHLNDLAGAFSQSGVLSGCAVTPSSGLQVAFAEGFVQGGATRFRIASGTVTLDASDPTFGRFDLVQVSTATGSVSKLTGAAAETPVEPDASTDAVKLAAVYVPPNSTAVTAAMITDRRLFVAVAPFAQGGYGTQVTVTVNGTGGGGVIQNNDTATSSNLGPMRVQNNADLLLVGGYQFGQVNLTAGSYTGYVTCLAEIAFAEKDQSPSSWGTAYSFDVYFAANASVQTSLVLPTVPYATIVTWSDASAQAGVGISGSWPAVDIYNRYKFTFKGLSGTTPTALSATKVVSTLAGVPTV